MTQDPRILQHEIDVLRTERDNLSKALVEVQAEVKQRTTQIAMQAQTIKATSAQRDRSQKALRIVNDTAARISGEDNYRIPRHAIQAVMDALKGGGDD